MFPLQSLPKLESSKPNGSAPKRSASASLSSASPHLAVLQEQRSQIAHFLERAQKERKLNDAAALRRNLEELDVEIAKMSVNDASQGGGPVERS